MISNMIYIAEVIIVFAYISKCANIKILIGNTRFFLDDGISSDDKIRWYRFDFRLLAYVYNIHWLQTGTKCISFSYFVWNISEYQTKLISLNRDQIHEIQILRSIKNITSTLCIKDIKFLSNSLKAICIHAISFIWSNYRLSQTIISLKRKIKGIGSLYFDGKWDEEMHSKRHIHLICMNGWIIKIHFLGIFFL